MITKDITEKDITNEFDNYLKREKIKYIAKNDARNHARGADGGFPDRLIFLPNGRVLEIEFKTPKEIKTKENGLSPRQVGWRDYLIFNKHNYYILSSAKEAILLVSQQTT